MERSSKVIAIVALCIGVVGLSLGFAAFSNTLTINSSATVTPQADTFGVQFSTKASSLDTAIEEGVNYVPTGATVDASAINIANAEMGADANSVLSGLNANFTEPGQQVVYTFYARNVGQYLAYLNNIAIGSKTCKSNGTVVADGTLEAAACEKISMTVAIDGITTQATMDNAAIGTKHTALPIGENEAITITIAYDAAGNVRPDNNLEVTFGDVVLTYNSVDTIAG